jgi:methionyl-tRNA formyltransferase
MIKKMDAGNIIKQIPIEISDNDNYDSLYEKFCNVAPKFLLDNFAYLVSGNVDSLVQDESLVTLSLNIKREDEKIDFSKDASSVRNHIRGLSSEPCAFFIYKGKCIKAYHSSVVEIENSCNAAEIIEISKKGILVKCGTQALILESIKIEGKNIWDGSAIKNSNYFKIGDCFE